jgi:hypothetical protein
VPKGICLPTIGSLTSISASSLGHLNVIIRVVISASKRGVVTLSHGLQVRNAASGPKNRMTLS